MNVIPLAHRRTLRCPACTETTDVSTLSVRKPGNTTVITFAQASAAPRRLDAGDRLAGLPDGDVVLSHFDVSPLAPLLLWDIAHSLPTGGMLYLQASDTIADLLTRSYYRAAFQEASGDDRHQQSTAGHSLRTFMKTAPLPAEADRGLERWSFCIPTGGGDPSALNACVARILALGVPEFEIILCGRPHADFRFWEKVRIVGEDIPAWPLHITRKKNILVQEASYPNLCILHDRVLLPTNFWQAVTRFGDDYPFTAFASFWFADRWQAVPRRYSDFGVAEQLPFRPWPKERLSRQALPVLFRFTLRVQHPARCDFERNYLTGSLYLCKRSVWQHVPQNENLFWQDYEDVEQGLYAAQAGIPSRLNPYSMTQSLSYRSIMHAYGYLSGMDASGKQVEERGWGEYLFPRRPHLALSEQEALERLKIFAQRYTGSEHLLRQIKRPLTGLKRYILIARLLWAANGDVHNLTDDWCHLVLCENLPDIEKDALLAILNSSRNATWKKLDWLRHISLRRQIYNNLFSSPFQQEKVKKTSALALAAGSFFGAWQLRYGSRHTGFRMSLFALWRLLFNDALREEETEHVAR